MTYDIAIIGAGFCGSMVAVNLARLAPRLNLVLIGAHGHGPGLAYSTVDPDHLLNVRAGQMAAFPDRPDHFSTWLGHGALNRHYTRDDFVPRQIYGHYLTELLEKATSPHLTLHSGRVVDIKKPPTGNLVLDLEKGVPLTAKQVVLALGNFPPEGQGADPLQNPYDPAVWQRIADEGDVLIVGTGLTSLDLVVTLTKTKQHGLVRLLSRHGFLPKEHTKPGSYDFPLDEFHDDKTLLPLFRRFRAEIEAAAVTGTPWQYVIDALRPLNQGLWQNLSLADKARFLRHLRAYWDVHRHRCATPVMDAFRELQHEGRLILHHGPIVTRHKIPEGWRIDWRARGSNNTQSFDVAHIVNCTGPQADFRKLRDPLVQNLLQRRMVTVDPLHLGIATSEDYVVMGEGGNKFEGIYALGSVLKGRLYESVAVPELREQACDIATILARSCGH